MTDLCTLSNGLTVAHEHASSETLALELFLPGGPLHETTRTHGAAGVAEAWRFRGSSDTHGQTRDAKQESDAWDALSATRDSTLENEGLGFGLQTLPEDFLPALGLLADCLMRPRFDPAELPACLELARADLLALEDDPSSKLDVALLEQALVSAHGRSAYGTLDSLGHMQAQDVLDVATLHPAQGILTSVGPMPAHEIFAALEQAFGSWTGPTFMLPDVVLAAPTTRHIAQDTAQTQIGLAYPSLVPRDPDWLLSRVALWALAVGSTSRLYERLREQLGLVYAVGADTTMLREASLITITASSTTKRAQETQNLILEMCQDLQHGLRPEEFVRVQRTMQTTIVLNHESVRAKAGRMRNNLWWFETIKPLEETLKHLEEMRLQDVNAWLHDHPMRNPNVLTLGGSA